MKKVIVIIWILLLVAGFAFNSGWFFGNRAGRKAGWINGYHKALDGVERIINKRKYDSNDFIDAIDLTADANVFIKDCYFVGPKKKGVKNYPAEPNRTIEATVITQYHVKTLLPTAPKFVVSGVIAYSGTFELPWETRYCVGCWRWPRRVWYEIPRTKKQFVKRYVEGASNRVTVETKKITGLKDDLYCNVTLPTQTCGNDLTDGAIIIRHRWETDPNGVIRQEYPNEVMRYE